MHNTVSTSSVENKLRLLKNKSGTHSPSISTLLEQLPGIKLEIDACFLCNPYATELVEKFYQDLFSDKIRFRELLQYYPSQNAALAEVAAKFLPHISPGKIFIGNGAIEIIQAVITNFCGKKMVVILPTFSSYYEFATNKLAIEYYSLKKEKNFSFNVREYVDFVKNSNADSIVIINPNNPTGTYISINDISYIVQELSYLKTIIIDESFIHFAYENQNLDNVSSEHLVNKYLNLIIIKSMSKDFGVAGIRLGYALMSEKRVSKLLKNGYLWNSNCLSEAFLTLLTNNNFQYQYQIYRKKYIKDLQELYQKLSSLKSAKVYPSSANFFLLELNNRNSFNWTVKLLVNFGIYVRDCNDKLGLEGNFIRIAGRTTFENEKIFNAIKMLLDKGE